MSALALDTPKDGDETAFRLTLVGDTEGPDFLADALEAIAAIDSHFAFRAWGLARRRLTPAFEPIVGFAAHGRRFSCALGACEQVLAGIYGLDPAVTARVSLARRRIAAKLLAAMADAARAAETETLRLAIEREVA